MINENKETLKKILLVRFVSGNINEIEKEEAIKLIESDPELNQYYFQLKDIWDLSEINKLDSNKAYNDFLSKVNSINIEPVIENRKTFKLKTKNALSIAAILATVILTLLYFTQGSKFENLITSSDKIISDTLPDNSIVSLNINSSIEYYEKRSDKNRKVKLSGEAFFQVEKSSKPFIINTNGLDIKVTGTSFNVRSYPWENEITVVVETGKIIMTCLNPKTKDYYETTITAGETGIFKLESSSLCKTKTSDLNYLSWKTGILVFKETRLSEAIKDIEEEFKVDIILSNPILKECKLTSRFDNQTLNSILEAISFAFNLEIMKEKNCIELVGIGC